MESNKKGEAVKLKSSVLLFLCIIFFNFFQIQCGSLLGRSGLLYTTTHNIFRDQQSAIGVVRISNGFSVVTPASGVGSTHGSTAFMDMCISVSGAIDLRQTNTIVLLADLKLESGVTFSAGGGRIYGSDHALILDGNLNIPSNTVLHFGGKTAIEGQGHTLILGDNSQLFVDQDATLTLRNLIVSNSKNGVGNSAIKLASSGSKLALDNSILDLTGDFYFDRGSLFVHNDVVFTGTNAFVYRSCQPSFIKSGSTLNFDVGTTLDFRPSTTGTPGLLAKDLLNMADPTSRLYLDGCMLKATLTGMRLTEGQVVFDNKVSITSQAALRLADYTTTVTNWVYHGESIGSVWDISWHPSARYVAVIGQNAAKDLTLFSFNGLSLSIMGSTYDFGSSGYGVDWSPDGRYLAACGNSGVSIYSFSGTSLSLVINIPLSTIYSIKWSTDGRYLAVAGTAGIAYVYSFNGTTLSLVASSVFSGSAIKTAWSSDGKYLAFLGTDASNNFRVYLFTGSALNLVDQRSLSASVGWGALTWSPDGHYIAVGINGTIQPGYQYLNIFYFTGSKLARVTGLNTNFIESLAWSADGGYLTVGFASASPNLVTYAFKNSTLTSVGSGLNVGTAVSAVSWSPNGNFLAIGAINATRPAVEFNINSVLYAQETQTQALSNSIVFGNSGLGSNYDLNVRLLAGSQVSVDGLVNFDNVN